MIREAIILAGGLGTRLRSAVPDLPKCMAPVAGKPFIWYLMKYLKQQGIESFIFSLGYKNEIIKEYLETNFTKTLFTFVIEDEPLGTGGAIKLACDVALEPNVIVLNGDTLFEIDVQKVAAFHQQHLAICTLSLKPMHDFDRYDRAPPEPAHVDPVLELTRQIIVFAGAEGFRMLPLSRLLDAPAPEGARVDRQLPQNQRNQQNHSPIAPAPQTIWTAQGFYRP